MTTLPSVDRWEQFASDGFTLRGRCWLPPDPLPIGVVCCHAVGEEKKSIHRSLVALAEKLAIASFPVLMFDYAGCGDSDGDDLDGNLARWQCNIKDAIRTMFDISGIKQVILLGVRLGGWLALQAAAEQAQTMAIVLWSPLLDLPHYASALKRQQRMTEITLGFARDTLTCSEQGMDLGGTMFSATLIKELDAATLPPGLPLNLLYLEPGARVRLSAEAEQMARQLQLNLYDVELKAIIDHPLRAQAVSPERPALVAETLDWIKKRYAGRNSIEQ